MRATSTSEPEPTDPATLAALAEIEVFSGLSPPELADICWTAEPFSAPAGAELFHEGAEARDMLCLTEGRVRLEMKVPGRASVRLPEIGPNETLGEIALMGGHERWATAIAEEPVAGFRIARHAFNAQRAAYRPAAFKVLRRLALTVSRRMAVLGGWDRTLPPDSQADEIIRSLLASPPPKTPWTRSEELILEQCRPAKDINPALLRALPIFGEFRDHELEELIADLRIVEVPRRTTIFLEGDNPRACYVTLRGAAERYIDRGDGRQKLSLHGPGRMFGHLALIDHSARAANCVTREDSVLLTLSREEFDVMFDGGSVIAYKLLDAVCALLSEDLIQSLRRQAWFRINITP